MRDDIYSTIRKRIIRGEYEQGAVIREADLAEEFHVSRTPIREVFQKLQHDKFIVLLPYRGAQVTFIEFESFFQLVAVKIELEMMAVRLAAKRIGSKEIAALRSIAEESQRLDLIEGHDESFDAMLRIDTAFHSTIRSAARNSVLAEYLKNMQAHIDRYFYFTRHESAKTMVHFADDFTKIIDALENHDQKAAEDALRGHMSSYYKIVRNMSGEHD